MHHFHFMFPYFFAANYLDNWKRIAVLKGDGSGRDGVQSQTVGGADRVQSLSGSGSHHSAAAAPSSGAGRYLKLGGRSQVSQPLWQWQQKPRTDIKSHSIPDTQSNLITVILVLRYHVLNNFTRELSSEILKCVWNYRLLVVTHAYTWYRGAFCHAWNQN